MARSAAGAAQHWPAEAEAGTDRDEAEHREFAIAADNDQPSRWLVEAVLQHIDGNERRTGVRTILGGSVLGGRSGVHPTTGGSFADRWYADAVSR